ncbi:MAG TPA: hypothetical protein PLN69_00840, partial [bacterium]|nr:hypothetical protein [bacterium]
DDEDLSITKEVTFYESNGVEITYDRLTRLYELEDKTVIEEPVESIEMKLNAGMENTVKVDLIIPSRVLLLGVSGKASAVINVTYRYEGTDNSNNLIKTDLTIPVKITSSVAEAVFALSSVEMIEPAKDQTILMQGGNLARVKITVSGTGSISGIWLLDNQFYKSFQKDVYGENEIVIEQGLPAALTGAHSIQFRSIMPEVMDTEVVAFNVEEGEEAPTTIYDFWAGFVHINGVEAVYDPITRTYTGSGLYRLNDEDEGVNIQFVRLKVEREDGKNILKRGIIAVELDYKFEKGPLTISLTKLLISMEGVYADGSVEFAGTDKLPGIGPFYFYRAGIKEDGISAIVELGSPQIGKVGFLEIAIDRIFFDYSSEGATIKASGWITTSPEKIFTLYLMFGFSPEGGIFEYSVEKKDDWIVSVDASGE